MIAGATRGAGGAALGSHLARADTNERVIVGESRGLVSQGIREQVEELTGLGSHARTRTPLLHMHADPPAGRPWTEDERARYWDLMEDEFGLAGRPFASVIHEKGGRQHEHRVYLRIRPDGTAIRMDHDHARREKVSRVMEWERDEVLTKGAHNRAVIVALRAERPEVAAAMEAAGLHEGPRPRAALMPQERAQQERTATSKQGVAATVAQAWAASDSGPAFAAALAEHGLVLARGDRRGGVPVVVDATGNMHGLSRMLGMAARAGGVDAPPSADVAARLDGMALPSVADARQAAAAPVPPPPDDGPPSPDTPPPPGGGQAAPVSADAPHAHVTAPAARGDAAPAAAQAAPGASLENVGSGPGEPPGPGAHPDEIARFHAALAAYEDRKAAAWARFMAAQGKRGAGAPAPAAGGHHGTTQHMAATQGGHPGGTDAARRPGAAQECGADSTGQPCGEPGHDGPGGGEGTRHLAGGEGREHEQQPGREPVAADDGAGSGRECDPGRHQGPADGHRGAADSPGRRAFQDRSQAHRAARGLATLSLSGLRDRLDPARVVVREAGRIRADIAGRRAETPDAPRTVREQRAGSVDDRAILALDRVMDRVHAGDPGTMADMRRHGFHEVLRQERLRVLMDEEEAARAGADASAHAAEHWPAFPR